MTDDSTARPRLLDRRAISLACKMDKEAKKSDVMNDQVLVLNQNYEPLNITNIKRAISLVFLGKAQVLETDSKVIRSERITIDMPTVVQLAYYVKRPLPELHLCRRSILARDNYTCQYCGKTSRTLTIDHVIPRNKGGRTTWENLVCSCLRCNNKKGDRTPREAGLTLRRRPERPHYIPYIPFSRFLAACENDQWWPYLSPFAQDLDIPRREADPPIKASAG